MKTIIVYGSKHGTTSKCVEQLKERMGKNIDTVNICNKNSIDLKDYSSVIIGSPIYAGSLIKEVKAFCENNMGHLKEKRLGLFITCMKQTGYMDQLNSAYPSELVSHAIIKDSFGGGMIYSDMGFLEKRLVKMVIKAEAKKNPNEPAISTTEDTLMLNEAAIGKFVESFII